MISSQITEVATDVLFRVSGTTSEWSTTGLRFMPDRVKVTFIDGNLWNIEISGPGVKKDGKPASRRGKAVYGMYGMALSQVPDWATELQIRAEHHNRTKWERA